MAFLLNSQAQGVSGKNDNIAKHHGAGPKMQRHLTRCIGLTKAGPACRYFVEL